MAGPHHEETQFERRLERRNELPRPAREGDVTQVSTGEVGEVVTTGSGMTAVRPDGSSQVLLESDHAVRDPKSGAYYRRYDEGKSMPQEQPQHEQPLEPLGAQVLRRVHDDHGHLIRDYDEMLGMCEHDAVKKLLTDELKHRAGHMDKVEAAFAKHYKDLPPLVGGMDAGDEEEELPPEEEVTEDEVPPEGGEELTEEDEPLPDEEEFDEDMDGEFDAGEADADREDEEPTGEEAFRASTKSIRHRRGGKALSKRELKRTGLTDVDAEHSYQGGRQHAERHHAQGLLHGGPDSTYADDTDPENDPGMGFDVARMRGYEHRRRELRGKSMPSQGECLWPHEHGAVGEAVTFLEALSQPGSELDEEGRMKSYHYHKTLAGIGSMAPDYGEVDGQGKDEPSDDYDPYATDAMREREDGEAIDALDAAPQPHLDGNGKWHYPPGTEATQGNKKVLAGKGMEVEGEAKYSTRYDVEGRRVPTRREMNRRSSKSPRQHRLEQQRQIRPKNPGMLARAVDEERQRREWEQHGDEYEAQIRRDIGAAPVSPQQAEREAAYHEQNRRRAAPTPAGHPKRSMDFIREAETVPPRDAHLPTTRKERPGVKSLHPHRKAASEASAFFRQLASEKAFGDPHREACAAFHKALSDLFGGEEYREGEDPEDEEMGDEEEEMEDEGAPFTPGQMGEKARETQEERDRGLDKTQLARIDERAREEADLSRRYGGPLDSEIGDPEGVHDDEFRARYFAHRDAGPGGLPRGVQTDESRRIAQEGRDAARAATGMKGKSLDKVRRRQIDEGARQHAENVREVEDPDNPTDDDRIRAEITDPGVTGHLSDPEEVDYHVRQYREHAQAGPGGRPANAGTQTEAYKRAEREARDAARAAVGMKGKSLTRAAAAQSAQIAQLNEVVNGLVALLARD